MYDFACDVRCVTDHVALKKLLSNRTKPTKFCPDGVASRFRSLTNIHALLTRLVHASSLLLMVYLLLFIIYCLFYF